MSREPYVSELLAMSDAEFAAWMARHNIVVFSTVTDLCRPATAHRYDRMGSVDVLRCYRCGYRRRG